MEMQATQAEDDSNIDQNDANENPYYALCGPDPNEKNTAMERYLADQFESWAANNKPTKLIKSEFGTPNRDSAIRAFLEAGVSTALPMSSPTMLDMEDVISESDAKQAMNKMKRVVMKGGESSIRYKNISKKRRKYFSDLYTTLLDTSWFFCVLLFTASFYLSWLMFAIIYFLISYLHGDLLKENLSNPNWTPCIKEVDGFSASFLFSLETQHTIGYGGRQTTQECPEAVIVVTMQAVLGCLIQAFMVGLVFSKLSRPQQRTKTVIFSQNAVINLRNKKLCLIIRIGDLRDDNFILGTKIACKLLRRKLTEEGEACREMLDLKVNPDSNAESCIFFVWPLEIIHVIDVESPLFEMSADDLNREKFELVVIMEGTIETSSMTFQARSSYLAKEILWGHRFESMTIYRRDRREFEVNFSAFHSTFPVETPTCSAKDLVRYQEQKQLIEKSSAMHLMNNLTNLPPNNVSSVLNLAHKMAEENREENLMSPLIGSDHNLTIRSNSMSGRESLLRKASVNAYLFQKSRGRNPGLNYTNSSGTSRPHDDTESQSDN